MECRECRGKGWVTVPDHCHKPASLCCGGCVKDEVCFVCEGDGELNEHTMDLDMLRAIETYERLLNHRFKHERTLASIYENINDIVLYKKLL